MLTRIVKMQFSPNFISEFKALFGQTQPKIAAFEGCRGVRLLRDESDPATFFTISHWENASDLENYRNSELFIITWKTVKPNFTAKAEAWSLIDP